MSRYSRRTNAWSAAGLMCLAGIAGALWASPPAEQAREISSGTLHDTQEAQPPAASDRLVLHEWGTFTCLQDETGRAIPGINTDDEPLPRFVHRLANELIIDPSDLAPVYYKGVPRVHQHVTMRLETPVIYFYPQAGRSEPLTLDVRVRFRGGWLTEYYPNANVDAPGLRQGRFRFGPITPETTGSLQWTNLTVGGNPLVPATDSRVWLAPRRTQATPLRTPQREGEKYLFYRGVGNVSAPLRVTRDADRDVLTIREHFEPALFQGRSPERPATTLWLAHIREDGAVAYRAIGSKPLTLKAANTLATVPASFGEGEYARENLARLREEMRSALIGDGLFADEAEALLNTWELGYFRSAGLRLFFMLPQEWTDAVLPLDLSVPAYVTRTMVGRIELVTPRHRELLGRIAATPTSDLSWFYNARETGALSEGALKDLWEGKSRLSKGSGFVPAEYRAYLDLGRFRNALILDELARTPNPGLDRFAQLYDLNYFAVDE